MLSFMQKTISLARFAKDPERIAREIEKAGTIYKIKRPNGTMLLVMDEAELYWREYLSHYPDWRKEKADAERELREGKMIPFEVVLAKYPGALKRFKERQRAEARAQGKGATSVRRATRSHTRRR